MSLYKFSLLSRGWKVFPGEHPSGCNQLFMTLKCYVSLMIAYYNRKQKPEAIINRQLLIIDY